MTAAITNPFKLTWGSFIVGGTTERLITGLHRISETNTTWELSCDVLIRGTSDADFASNCSEMEDEFRKRRQALTFEIGTDTIQSKSHSGNTGLNTWARIDKRGTDGADTGRSRLYTITVGCELPADDASGRRDSSVLVNYSPAQLKTVTIEGTWTALSGNDATAQYDSAIGAYATSTLTAVDNSATFELIEQETRADDQDKVLTFRRVYREIIANQPGASPDSTDIVEFRIQWSRERPSPGDSRDGTVRRLERVTATWSCWADQEQTLDLEDLYTSTVRDYLKDALLDRFSPIQHAIVSESHTPQPFTNSLSGVMVFVADIEGSERLIESVVSVRYVESSGTVFTPAWTGRLFDKYADQGLARRLRFWIRAERVLGHEPAQLRVPRPPSGNWHLIDNDSKATQKKLGPPGEDQIDVTDLVDQIVEEWATEPDNSRYAPSTVGEDPEGDPGGQIITPDFDAPVTESG